MSILSTLGLENCASSFSYTQYAVFIAITGLILVNVKGVVGFWHVRLFKGLITQYFLAKAAKPETGDTKRNGKVVTVAEGIPRLYSYLVTAHRNSPIDCDYNMHKSNSTFFSDLDINRAQLLIRLFGGFPRWKSTSDGEAARKNNQEKTLNVALGGVSCVFKREIRLFQRFEIWSRVLAWDDKWLYIVSYFVLPGTGMAVMKSLHEDAKKGKEFDPNKAILASSLSRYVFKDRRMTIRPEDTLVCNGLYPAAKSAKDAEENQRVFISERDRALEVARFFHGLDTLPSHFGIAASSVLGRYSDP